jgi:polyhydroxybutyrate depolymerase
MDLRMSVRVIRLSSFDPVDPFEPRVNGDGRRGQTDTDMHSRLGLQAIFTASVLANQACTSDTTGPWRTQAPNASAGGMTAPPAGSGATPGVASGGAVSGAGGASSNAGGATGGSVANTGGVPTTSGAGGAAGSGVSGAGGTAPDAGSDGDSGPRGSGPGDWGPGDYPPSIMDQTYLDIAGVAGQGMNTRQYKVHVPPGYDPQKPTPLVFCIHGLAQNAVMFCVAGAAMHEKSDKAGFIMVMPNGFQNSWNAGTCCGGASTSKLDDVALFRAILAEVAKHVNVDYRRVYATGLSNGAYMSYRLACDAPDLFAAVAPAAGAVGKNDIGGGTNPMSDFTTCAPASRVSVLDMHGTADGLIAYSLQAPSLAIFAKANGCGTSTAPAAAPPSGGDTTCLSYTGCADDSEVIGCSIMGGGHCWFGSPDCGTGGGAIGAAFVGANSTVMKDTDAMWEFFSHHVKR